MKAFIFLRKRPIWFLGLIALLFALQWFSKGYNLPGQNVISFILVLLVFAYQAHVLRMYYARNILLAVIVVYLPHSISMAEKGSYDPRAYLSFIQQTIAMIILMNVLANIFAIFLK